MEENEPNFDLTKASEICRYAAHHKEPYFDMTKTSQLGKYAAHYIDEFRTSSENEKKVLKMLGLILSPNFEYYLKVVNDKRFVYAFNQKIGKKRRDFFKSLACKIDDKYKEFDYTLD